MDNLKTINAIDLWTKVMSTLEKELSQVSIERWFHNLTPVEIKDNTLIVSVPDEFFKDWIEDHYTDTITNALKSSGSTISHFKFSINPKAQAPSTENRLPEETITSASWQPKEQPADFSFSSPAEKPKLKEQYTFEDFVVGPSNRFAHAASKAVADQPAKAYNPLFIHGPVGLGKTHLMQAIGHQVMLNNSNARILYITSEKFTNQLINAIQNRSTLKFREKYRSVDILLIDDIHFIAGKEATQEEFFHTFNALHDDHKQIVVSSDRTPKDIINMEERLISRFEWGLVTDIQLPDFETRSAILRKKAERHNITVPDSVTNFIAEVIQSNIRELEGALMRVVAYSQLIGQPINADLAQEVLKRSIQSAEKKVSVRGIQDQCASYFSIRIQDMTSKRRSKNIVLPRQIAMYLVRDLTDHSLPEIGNAFGGRDHTTVMHACDKIRKQIESESSVREVITRIKQELGITCE